MLSKSLLSCVAVGACLGGSTALAQTGPWTDGEMIVNSYQSGTAIPAFFRINPENGMGAELVSGFSWWGWSGGYAFDSVRGTLLANVSFPGSNSYLYSISYDGSKSSIPGFDFKRLRAMAPAGDGRVFFQEVPASSIASGSIQYLDTLDNIQTVLDASGTTPFLLNVNHLIYHKASNALIATASTGSIGGCNTNQSSVFRIPLSTDGTRVGGPVTCASFATGWEHNTSLDLLSSGQILLTLTSAAPFIYPNKLITVDPNTLTFGASLAGVHPALIHGGHYNERIGKFVVLDNGLGNVLRTYAPGEVGNGTILPTNTPLITGMGHSPVNFLIEVNLAGCNCPGLALIIGTGLAGSGGFVPALSIEDCPSVNNTFTLHIDQGRGGAKGVLFTGLTPGNVPAWGGTLYLGSFDSLLPITLGGTPGVPGAGSLAIPVLITDPAAVGITFYLQAAFRDFGAVQNVSLTNGLRITIG